MFGDDPLASADERDDADRSSAERSSAERAWYEEQRPPHHEDR